MRGPLINFAHELWNLKDGPVSLAIPRRSSAVGEYEEAVAQIGAQEESSEHPQGPGSPHFCKDYEKDNCTLTMLTTSN